MVKEKNYMYKSNSMLSSLRMLEALIHQLLISHAVPISFF